MPLDTYYLMINTASPYPKYSKRRSITQDILKAPSKNFNYKASSDSCHGQPMIKAVAANEQARYMLATNSLAL